MNTLSRDTSPEVERVYVELLRNAPVWRKVQQLNDVNRVLSALTIGALRRRNPQHSPGELRRQLAEQWLGATIATRVYGREMVAGENAMLGNSTPVLLLVIEQLEKLGVPYLLGGSMASSVHGMLRATLDADLVVDMRPEQVDSFVQALAGAFYVDDAMIHDAITRRTSFNVIHLQSMFKVDLFILKRRRYDVAQFERRAAQTIDLDPQRTIFVATPEDVILAKLEWYRLGNEVSERQWSDVLGVLKVQADALDLAYLRYWAAQLDVADLLERALETAGL